ncbi:hypothetical protein B8W69_03580 [Mycobacterium vulneris]|uniref:Uncharacterized protein n=1 Tax=Mycolicibacterium vulneris TaxID=547163 RepID=A0A1X2LC01_9MYCO|nr:hypothetical protein [Mycolicibacterium vulneris]OSC31540.1 hypothetical protein B8W69_03580 [Mycolicibacterium vulneris]
MDVTGDLLSAASLLLASVGLLFSAWQAEITSAVEVSIKGMRADRGPRISQVKQALLFRALPLLLAVLLIVATLAPPALGVIIHSLTDCRGNPYDPIRAMFLGVWILAVGLAFAVGSQLIKLNSKRRLLNRPDAATT